MTTNIIHTIRFSAVILLSAGYGWAGGHFYPINSSWWAYFFQYFLVALLLLLCIGFFTEKQTQGKRKVYFITLTILSAVTFIVNIINLLHGINNTTNFGSHNNLSDIIPIGILLLGSFLWLITLLSHKE